MKWTVTWWLRPNHPTVGTTGWPSRRKWVHRRAKSKRTFLIVLLPCQRKTEFTKSKQEFLKKYYLSSNHHGKLRRVHPLWLEWESFLMDNEGRVYFNHKYICLPFEFLKQKNCYAIPSWNDLLTLPNISVFSTTLKNKALKWVTWANSWLASLTRTEESICFE